MPHRINKDECISCGVCESECPVSCIREGEDTKRIIDEDKCIDCGRCASVCPVSCISQL